jgi:hypothetical protein
VIERKSIAANCPAAPAAWAGPVACQTVGQPWGFDLSLQKGLMMAFLLGYFRQVAPLRYHEE